MFAFGLQEPSRRWSPLCSPSLVAQDPRQAGAEAHCRGHSHCAGLAVKCSSTELYPPRCWSSLLVLRPVSLPSLLCFILRGITLQGAFPRLPHQLPSGCLLPTRRGQGEKPGHLTFSLSPSPWERGTLSRSRCVSSSAPAPSGWPLPLRSQLLQRKFTVALALCQAMPTLALAIPTLGHLCSPRSGSEPWEQLLPWLISEITSPAYPIP